MNEEQVRALIQEFIIANGNNEITANVLRPILIAMLEQPNEIIGDLELLNTTDTTTIVNAINSILNDVNQAVSGYVRIHQGETNPNLTPPENYSVGDFYVQIDDEGNAIELFQYNGYNWVSTTPISDGFTENGTITLTGDELDITGFGWSINNTPYYNEFPDTFTIESEPTGTKRRDIVVTNDNDFVVIQGTPTTGTPLEPATPIGSLKLTDLYIDGDVINGGNNPIIGTQFITKSSYGWTQSNISGENATIIYQSDANAFELINPALVSIDSVAVSIEDSYNGQQVWVLNNTGNSVILNNNASGGLATFLPFIFPLGQDMTISNNGLVRFKRKDNEMLFESYSIVGSGDFIPRSGTVEGQPITGDLESTLYNKFKWIGDGYEHSIRGTDEYLELIASHESGTNVQVSFNSITGNIEISNNSETETPKGIIGNQYFDKQGDPNAFAQMQDIEEASQDIDEVLGVDNVATLPLIMKNSSIFFQNSSGQQIAVLKNNSSSSLLLDLINLGLNVPFVVNGKVSLGTGNTTTGAFSIGIGQNNTSSAPASVALGHNNIAVNYGEVVVGNLSNQDSTGQRTFGVGVGNLSGGTNRKDGLNVFLTGEVTAPELTTALINSGTARILTTKEWVNGGLALKANDADVLHKTGNEVKNGSLTVNSLLMVTPQMRIGNDSGYLQWIGLTNDLSDRRFTFESDPGVSGGKNFFIYAGGQLIQTWLESKTAFAKPVELGKYTNGTEPALITGAVYFNTTKDRLMIGRSDGWLAIDELKSPNGSKFKINVSDTGVLTTTSA